MVKHFGKIGNTNMNSNFFKDKKVLITGHTGFKGSWASIWLTMLGAKVYGYALKPYTNDDNFLTCGIENIMTHTIGDVCDAALLADFFDKVQPDIAFHFAAQPLVLKSYTSPAETFQTNLMGVVNFFEAVRKTPSVIVAINVTSDKCYDNKEWLWGYRENDMMGGKDPYSASKGCSELITSSYINSFFQKSTCKVASVRAGNVIGGGDWAEDRIVPDFFRAVKSNAQLKIRNPHATRPWQHVLEPLSGYFTLAALLYNDKRLVGGWNFGPHQDKNFSVKILIENMMEYGKMGNCIFESEQQKFHEASLLKLDISKAINYLEWQPTLTFNETISYTVDGYLDELNKKDLLKSRMGQIENYMLKAQTLNISWAQN